MVVEGRLHSGDHLSVFGTWQPHLQNCALRGGRVDPQNPVSVDSQNDLTLRIQVLHQVGTVLTLKFFSYRSRGWFVAHSSFLAAVRGHSE